MKKLFFILAFVTAFTANAGTVTINETTNPLLDTTFLDAGASNLDTNTGLYWLNFSDLVAGDLTLGYSMDNNVKWFGPQGWRLPTYTEVYGLFDTFFEPDFVADGDGKMIIDEDDGQSLLIQSRNSWMMGFGTDAAPVVGSINEDDAILRSVGLYIDENGDIQMMGIDFDVPNLTTTIYGPGYNTTGFDYNTAYPDLGVFMVYDTVVPIPAAVWLFGSGLIGLVAVARRKVQ